MVVVRRTPVVPPQPPARNPSQGPQRPPRTSLAKDAASVPKNAASSVAVASPAGPSNGNNNHHSGLGNNSGKRPKKSKRHGRTKDRKSNFEVFLDFLTKLLVLGFTIYTFSICPQDTHLQSPICRGLTEYKRIVLDPYIIPPIQAVLAHPSVAPHIERATPYVHRAVEITAPILLRTQQQWNLHVIPQWEKHVIPEWNKRVIPQWNTYVVPQWDKHVAPRLQLVQSTLEPYCLRVAREYEQRIVPRAQVAIYNLQRWQRQAQPYVILAVSKAKDGYHAAKPYAGPLVERAGHVLQQFALFLRVQRQKFFDPHVAKMWEKVKELSRGRQVPYEATPEHEPTPSKTLFTNVQSLDHEIIVSSTDSFTSACHATPMPEQTDVAQTLSSLDAGETAETKPHSIPAESTFVSVSMSKVSTQPDGTYTSIDSFLNTESGLPETSHESERPTSGTFTSVQETAATKSSVWVAATTGPSSRASPVEEPTNSLAVARPSQVTLPVASATVPPENSRADDEIDFDAFYAELGLDEPLGIPDSSEEYNPGPPAETEEERAERLRAQAEETARKRANIEARQAKWESELQAQMERSTFQLQNRLSNLRTAAGVELSSSAEVRRSIEELVNESEKYLKGAEIYLKNLKGENRRSDEKLSLWDRVAERVNDKFSECLLATEGVINAWHRIILDKELQEVATVAAEVREVAEKAQLDLGLDYAWLEDVTYNDWQRYHALIGTSEQYAHEASSIQNGTHPKIAVTNPMTPIIEDLESEVEDVAIGFRTRFRRIKRDGERAFNNYGNGVAQKEEEKGTNAEPEVEAESEASILPAPREGAKGEEQGVIPPVVIGRSQEEVLEALGKVEPVKGAEHSVSASESHVDPEEAVSRLVREVEDGAEVSHTEL